MLIWRVCIDTSDSVMVLLRYHWQAIPPLLKTENCNTYNISLLS